MKKQEISIVDDEPINLMILKKLLSPSFLIRAYKSGSDLLQAVEKGIKPDLILMDIMMPGMDGYETLAKLRKNPDNHGIPVIYISALDSLVDEEKGFSLGAVDYITKPFRLGIVLARVNAHLELKQARDRLKNQNEWLEAEVKRRMVENQLIQDTTLNVFAELVETRDNDTANHVLRTQNYVRIIAKRLQKNKTDINCLDDDDIERIVKAAPLHDIGKIGIPDAILLKPGKLSAEEYEIMKTHCKIGGNAIRLAINKTLSVNETKNEEGEITALFFLEEAEKIMNYHHERWDGKGYPEELTGDEIPISARIMALADVFDALTTVRPYKKAWNMETVVTYILEQKGLQFDPNVVEAFEKEIDAFAQILNHYKPIYADGK
ncbi:HD-GYP domain-containing protein [Acetobacterium woodii]|uniref:Stage 0 sporulation protein A homolog n=1 Tax=Acetobacterium woodii (strain ATCC 29683 / DSM 1030 / JCM 2381 / KCTC 1655 / WB1) TaxID=931626 RepID=H6LIF1_ACEWD|nr:HD domain-containing phosphohydrolase [Acetobacterium woodii]AFA47325.1 response regulator [Acetobacterium woodii DSM 1030]